MQLLFLGAGVPAKFCPHGQGQPTLRVHPGPGTQLPPWLAHLGTTAPKGNSTQAEGLWPGAAGLLGCGLGLHLFIF